MCTKSNRELSQQPSFTVSKASSLLRVSSLEFERIYNRHNHMRIKLQEKHRRMLVEKNNKERMNTIMRQKEQLKFSLINHNDDTDKILLQQSALNNDLRHKRQQCIRTNQQNRFQQNCERAHMIKQQMRENHIKKKLMKQNNYLQSYVKRKQQYDGYYKAIESTNDKNKTYQKQVKEQNKKDIQKMMNMKKEIDSRAKKFKKLELALRKKLNQKDEFQ